MPSLLLLLLLLLALLPFTAAQSQSLVISSLTTTYYPPSNHTFADTITTQNSTLTFLALDPTTSFNTTCFASWAPPNYPFLYTSCEDPTVQFAIDEEDPYSIGLGLGTACNFTLDLLYTYADQSDSGNLMVTVSTTNLTCANTDANQPSTLLACTPSNSTQNSTTTCTFKSTTAPIAIYPFDGFTINPYQINALTTYSPSPQPLPRPNNTTNTPTLTFTIFDPASPNSTTTCTATWPLDSNPPSLASPALCKDTSWTFALILPPSSSSSSTAAAANWLDNFELLLEHTFVGETGIFGQGRSLIVTRARAAVAGTEMLGCQCGGSGVCWCAVVGDAVPVSGNVTGWVYATGGEGVGVGELD